MSAVPGPPLPGPPPSSGAADAAADSSTQEALDELEAVPVDDLDETARTGAALDRRLRERLDDVGSS